MRRGQLAVEFLVLFSIVMIIFLILFFIIGNQRNQNFSTQDFSQLQLQAISIAAQLDRAVTAGNGYFAAIPIQASVGATTFNVTMTTGGSVILRSKVGTQVVQAIAYSTAKTVSSDSSFFVSNTAFVLPTQNGTIVIQNEFGTVCVDLNCTAPSNVVSQISLNTQNVYAAQFNGQNSRILVGSNALNLNDVSVSAWLRSGRQYASDPNGDTYHIIISKGVDATGGGSTSGSYTIGWGNGQDQQLSFGVGIVGTAYPSPIDTNTLSGWNFVVGTYNGVAICLYVDTVFSGCTAESGQIQSTSDPFVIGSDTQGRLFNGSVSNVQVYDTALSSQNVYQLYSEGISGAPISQLSSNVVAWYPLDGNANDYSGNGNNPAPSNIISVNYATVSQLNAHVTNPSGSPVSNALVGFTATLGNLSAPGSYLKTTNLPGSVVNYTNSNGIATAFLGQAGQTGYSVVRATAFNGNLSTQMNLSGWWPLNEQQGSIAHDLSGNGNSGNIINGTWSQPNYVAQFDGQTSYVQMNLSLAGMSPGTVSAWVYPQSNGVIFQDGIYIGGDGDPLLLVLNKNMNASLDINNGAWVIDKGNIALAKNKWYMVTGTWTGDTMSLYVDGLTDNSVTFGFSVTPETCATCIYSALGYSSWGNKGNPSLQEQYTGGSTPFAGRMANVQVYGTALTASQVYSLYQEGIAGPPITSANAIGWYPLNGDTIDRAKSYNELVYNGAIVGNLQFVSPSSSVRSSPSNTTSVFTANFIASKLPYVTGNAPQINTAAGGFNTVSFWMDWPGNTNMMPFSFGSYDFWLNSDTCAGFNTFNSDVYGFNPSSIVNRWVFVTATFINNEPYTNNNLIYINGARQTLSQCGGTQAIRSATNNYQISGNNGDTYTFVGQLANFQIYNTSLTQSQINQLYSEGIAGSPLSANLVAWYPLDGNANDYSGNGNTGIQVKMQYSTVAASAGTENMNMPSSLSHISSEFQTIGLLNPQAAPPPIVLYEPIQLYNAQTAATPNPFQYMLTVDSATYSSYEASNLQNIEFFYPNGTVIPSWLESCSTTCGSSGSSSTSTVYWLKLTSPIPAGGYAYIYMGFAPTSINMFNGANTGEAPQLSPTYAEYDDGKNVFSYYQA